MRWTSDVPCHNWLGRTIMLPEGFTSTLTIGPPSMESESDVGTIGKFYVLETLGTGAHSTILHVRRAADAKHYALKVVPIEDKDDQKFLEQAQHEHRVAQMLDHPNLIKIYALEL